MAYFAVMAAAMGLQQLKAWQDNKHKDLLSEKQKELRVALQKREFDRARNLQAETQRISLEMEREAHELRRKEIENEYDTVFDSLTDQFHLEKWPLNVVPFIMKGESFGSHVKGYDVASIHCVLTPSNNIDFNRWIYGRLDMSVEILMNLNWNSNTDHNIVYYGNSWKPKTNMGIPKFENSDVHRLYADLRNVPFICLTPYFKETTGKFYLHVRIWGMGADIDENSTKIYPPPESELGQICSESNFSEIAESIISQLSTYVVSMIGFIADMYYWKMYELPPMLPQLQLFNSVGDSNKFLHEEYKSFFVEETINNYKSAIYCFDQIREYLPNKDTITMHISKILCEKLKSISEDIDMVEGLRVANRFVNLLPNVSSDRKTLIQQIKECTTCTKTKIKPIFINSVSIKAVIENIKNLSEFAFENDYFYFTVWSPSTIIGRFGDAEGNPTIYQSINEQVFFLFLCSPLIDYNNNSLLYYRYNKQSNKITKMSNSNFEEKFGQDFERAGRALGRVFDSFGSSRKSESVWDTPQKDTKGETKDTYEQVINYFKAGVESKQIDFQHVENLNVQSFLEWIDENNNPFATKVYVVKGYLPEHKKFIFCIFFANEDKVFLSPADKKKCFITSSMNDELLQTFGDNSLCVITLKQ